MTWPTINVTEQNLQQGPTGEIERHLLFIGEGVTGAGQLQAVTPQSNLDALLGAADSVLKSNLNAALLNAGQNAYFHVYVLKAAQTWDDAVREAQLTSSFEGVVVAMDCVKADITKANTLRTELTEKYGRWTWFILSIAGIVATGTTPPAQTWAEYVTAVSNLVKGVAASAVQTVPRNWGNEPGVLAGRLCNRSVTIADSPARVMTGALLALGRDDLPVDKNSAPLDLGTLQTLEGNRFSVPMWYPDYDGNYWADGRTLDVAGGDYQSIRNLRVVDKAARRIRIKGIARIGDRSLNSTPKSVEANKQYFAGTLREMAKNTVVNNVAFPGECMPPQSGDVAITWVDKVTVNIYVLVRTYDCPLGIGINIMLATSTEGGN
ncbi:DUF2586 family protein [Serratia proteamaculans]|uniref:DUF2586 family protein n=1 Tax=Serratia proteamaculans TaxID=28151 RepID=A0ABS0TVP5_SERPR|nr:DUF2586 domain-containing protein [Serratia proteamaculans]MBI6182404.1 DUF2586 family protein [Serratia proteamaculans]